MTPLFDKRGELEEVLLAFLFISSYTSSMFFSFSNTFDSSTPNLPPDTASQGSTDVLERTWQENAPGDSERFAHYVRKERIAEAMIAGKPVVALCGKVWIPSRNPDRYPVCPTCKEIYKNMGNNGSEWPFGSDVPGES